MPLLAGVVLPALELEDDDLLAEPVPNDLAGDRRAGQRGHAGANAVAVRAEEHLAERDLRPGLAEQRRHAERLTRLDAELLAARADDSVSHGKDRFSTFGREA